MEDSSSLGKDWGETFQEGNHTRMRRYPKFLQVSDVQNQKLYALLQKASTVSGK